MLVESAHLFRGSVCFQLCFFFSRARDCTMFTLHSLTDFYVERVTAHRIQIYDHSCFHNLWPNSKTKQIKTSLGARRDPWCFGALRSLLILRVGRIGSGHRRYLYRRYSILYYTNVYQHNPTLPETWNQTCNFEVERLKCYFLVKCTPVIFVLSMKHLRKNISLQHDV